MDMKNTLVRKRTLKLIASHSLLIAIITQPYFVSLFTDLYVIFTGKFASGFSVDNILASMAVLSGVAFSIAVIAGVLYFMRRKQ